MLKTSKQKFMHKFILTLLFFNIFILVETNGQKYEVKSKEVQFNFIDSSTLKSNITKAFVCFDSINFGHPGFLNKKMSVLTISAPSLMRFADENQTPYLIYPGENISIGREKNNLIFTVLNKKQRTSELLFFVKLTERYKGLYNFFPVLDYQKKVATIGSIQIFEKEIARVKENRINYLDSFAKSNPIGEDFKKFAINQINVSALRDTILLYSSNRQLIPKDIFKNLLLDKLKMINEKGYQFNPDYLTTCANIISMLTTNFLAYEVKDSVDIVKRYEFVNKNLSGSLRECFLANTLYFAFFKSIPVSNDLIKNFFEVCKDENFSRFIVNIINEKQQKTALVQGRNNLLLNDGKTIIDLQKIIEKNKGKLIYIDFWASWCSPCRAEMPYSLSLKKEYLNSKIEFLYISTDTRNSDWLQALKEEKISNSSSYLLLNSDNAPIINKNKIFTIPRYMLIDKNGAIIDPDAPRPSDPKLKVLIKKYL